MTIVLIDARNVLRSRWPNVPEDELVDRIRTWADREGMEAQIVFDGRAPEGGIGTARESADDWIARAAAQIEEPYWLVTSDRDLKARAGGGAERTIGGGAFVRELGLL
jgi:predicted RNA-binding protein with PIN domain